MVGLDAPSSADNVAHVIQVALTPVFLLSGIASLLGVFSGRLARVADRVDALSEKINDATPAEKPRLTIRLDHYRRRSHVLDTAVVLGTIGGGATCLAALLLFIAMLLDNTINGLLFLAFGVALLSTAGALIAFLTEMLMASRGIRERVAERGGSLKLPEGAETEPASQDPPNEPSSPSSA